MMKDRVDHLRRFQPDEGCMFVERCRAVRPQRLLFRVILRRRRIGGPSESARATRSASEAFTSVLDLAWNGKCAPFSSSNSALFLPRSICLHSLASCNLLRFRRFHLLLDE